METSGSYLAFDILESLKNVRDTRKCLEGLNKLRNALKSQDGLHVLGQLAEATPNFEELIIIWDSQIKAQEHHVAITLMLTLTDIFTALSTKSKPPSSSAAVTAANAVATALLSRRLRSFYSHLSSQQRTRATGALLLLAAIASLSPSTARELVRVFDFGLSALPQLARSIRPRKGETSEQAGIRQRQEWTNSDPLKRPIRAAFTTLCQALLLTADAQLLPEILRLRPLLGGTLHHISNDPPMVQLEMLKIMQKRVLASKVSLGSATRAELFSDATLGQLAAICAAGEDDDGTASAVEEENIADIRRQASDMSFSILHSVCTDPSNGLCASKEACLEFRTLQASGISALNPGQRRLLRWLQRLKPAESWRQGELLRATIVHDPALAAAMLLSLPYSMEPTATGKWLVHSSIVGSLMQSVASAHVGLVELAERGLAPPELSSRSMQAVLRCGLPLSLPRSALSRGVQHSNALVRHAVLCLLANMLSVLQNLLEEVQRAAAALPSSSSVLVHQEWKNVEIAIQQTSRASLPDLQPIIAQLSAALKPSQKKNSATNISGTKNEKKKAKASAMEIDLDTINIILPESDDEKEEEEGLQVDGEEDIVEGSEKEASLNTALFSATVHVLQRWRRCLPTSFAESNIDAEKLVPDELSTLPPLHQLQMLALLQTDSGYKSRKEGANFSGTSSTGPALLPVLKLLASGDENKQVEVKNAASSWAVQRLISTGLFEANPAEAFLWIDLIPVSESGVVSGFLHDAIGLVLRKPAEFYSFIEAEGISPGTGSRGPAMEMSLLVLCVLRQVLRVLMSDKRSVEEKIEIATYTSRVAALTVMQQKEQISSAAASSALLNVFGSEASRETGAPAAGDNNIATISGQKRKPRGSSSIAAVSAMLGGLGPSAAPLAALATWLEAVSSSISLVADNVNTAVIEEIEEKKKSKKAKKEGAQDGGGVAVANGGSTTKRAPLVLPLTLFPDLPNPSADSDNISRLFSSVPLCQLSLAVFHLGYGKSSTWSPEQFYNYLSSLFQSDAASQRAPLVIRQALHFISTTSSSVWKKQPDAASMLCAVLRGTIATTLKHPSFFKQAESCISLVCSLKTLLNAIETSDAVAIELWQWLFQKVTATATDVSSSSLVISISPVVTKVVNHASKAASRPSIFQQAPDTSLSKLLPLAAAAAHGPSEFEAAKIVLCSLLDSISNNIKFVDAQWITTTGEFVTSLLVSASDKDVEAVLEAGCRVIAALLAAQRSSEACALLENFIQPHHRHQTATSLKVLQLLDDDVISAALIACVTVPNHKDSSLACFLLKNSDVARNAFRDALKQGRLIGELPSSIALLPALTTYYESFHTVNSVIAEVDDVEGLKGALQPYFKVVDAMNAILKQLLTWISQEENEGLEEELVEMLHAWGLRYLTLALPLAEPSEKFILEALHSLLPADNGQWSLTSFGVLKAAAVDALLRYLLTSPARAAAAPMLAPLARSFFLTVSAAFKTKSSSKKSAAQRRTGHAFLQLLDASLSDAIAALPDSERNTSAFAKIAADTCTEFGTAVLKKRAEDPVAMRVLRRFTAALLPSNDGGVKELSSSNVEELSNSKVAVAAAALFQKVVSHSHFLSTMKNAAASPPALPAAAAVVPLPLQSLLPLVEAPSGSDGDPSKEEKEEVLFQKEPLAQVKRELCMLLETLLDVEDTFKSFKKSSGEELSVVETALLPVVMAAYGGSCSAADRAAWDLAKSLNLRAWKKSQSQKSGLKKMEIDTSSDSDSNDDEWEDGDVQEELCALLEGPLAKTCFAWGPSAVAAAASLPSAAATGNIFSSLQALQSKLTLDPLRCALTVTHFPEKCLLFGGDGGSGSSSGEELTKPAAAGDGNFGDTALEHVVSMPKNLSTLLPTSPAAYDPSFLIPFCVAALRMGLLPPRLFTQAGLASVCLRATAAEDPGLRAMAFEALGLLTQQLQSGAKQQKEPFGDAEFTLAAPKNAEHTASFEKPVGDFKERAQLLSLLEWFRDALETPFSRLPAIHAVFLAEAALLVSHPSHPMFGPMSRAQLKTVTLDVSLVPLFRQTILSGSQDARFERSWLLRLLRAGLRSSADAHVYLRQYVFELVMSLYDAAFVDSGTLSLALGVILAACSVPRAARELVERGGLIGWLASRAASSAAGAIASTNEKAALNKFEDAVAILNALQTLTTLRAVVGGGKGSARAAEDFAQACRCLLSMLCSLSESTLTPSQRDGLSKVWAATMPVISWTEKAAAGACVAFLGTQEMHVVQEKAERISKRIESLGEKGFLE